jgi:hypothetical protein
VHSSFRVARLFAPLSEGRDPSHLCQCKAVCVIHFIFPSSSIDATQPGAGAAPERGGRGLAVLWAASRSARGPGAVPVPLAHPQAVAGQCAHRCTCQYSACGCHSLWAGQCRTPPLALSSAHPLPPQSTSDRGGGRMGHGCAPQVRPGWLFAVLRPLALWMPRLARLLRAALTLAQALGGGV